ncbi:collagenase [Streptomyces caatingaensis]|uniref:microbial collagenase n=1 Tax=Streptomyces caatingaensis TaxID=1678637 RepID=A0A0K9XC02_9ACTN|nr:collagenase [Streptomyces caatingaensis]KNB50723.1 peptidase M9 [Streptomyces caatingaensis]
MSHWRPVHRTLLAAAAAAALLVPANLLATAAAAPHERPAATADDPRGPRDQVPHLAKAPKTGHRSVPAPGGLPEGRIPGPRPPAVPPKDLGRPATAPCTLDGVTGLGPERFADFLTDPAVTADGCLRQLIWTWDPRLAPVMSRPHVQAVSRRISALSPAHDGRDGSHLLELLTYLHAVVYQDFSHSEIDVTDPATTEAMRRAVNAFGTARHSFDVTRENAESLREALYAGSGQGLRQSQLPLIRKVLATMDPYHTTFKDPSWGGAALAGLSVNYLGLYPGNNDTAFRTVAARNAAYRDAFRAFARHTHLKGTPNEWVVRDAIGEYGRFGEIAELRDETVNGLGALLPVTEANFGALGDPWAKAVAWLVDYRRCSAYHVCEPDLEQRLFPRAYSYDGGGITVRTALDRDTVDHLYYASKQVKEQFFRVLGTDRPLADDTNSTLHIVLYDSRAHYAAFQTLLTGLSTENGGMYIEDGATFYTYQRRVPQDSSLTLEELFRHEYTHYLNGRWAVPGLFGSGPWYEADRTTAMDEGTAEFFAGSTRDAGVKVRKSLVKGVIKDTSGGGPRMSVNRLLHATYDGDHFRFYDYAGTFFEFLWTEHPSMLREMYGLLRANDPGGFDAWRDRAGRDTSLQRAYDAFLDRQIAQVDGLHVPSTDFTPNDRLRESSADAVRASFAAATYLDPACAAGPDPAMRRFVCTGRITARLDASGDPDRVFQDVSRTVDAFVLERARPASPNLADMNCHFGTVDIWPDGTAGTTDYTCEGPLRR